MLLINLNPESKKPLFRQVFEELKAKIDKDILKPGEKLPSTRSLSQQLGVNRTTVYRAYEELWALGYIDSKPGSYSRIRKPKKVRIETEEPKESLINWKLRTSEKTLKMIALTRAQFVGDSDRNIIDFRPLSPDPALLPSDDYRKCLSKAVSEKGSSILGYGDPLGYKELRSFLARRMTMHGIQVSEKEIMVTNGIQNGIELVLKSLVKPGSKILTEEPTYSAILPLFNYYDADIISVPMDESGIKLDSLEQVIKKEEPAFLYTIPNFQNPTGITTSQEHREQLLQIAEKHQMPILEDGFEEEMKYFGKAVLPIKSMDKNNIVIYFGTFSKVLFPGLRIGWIVADKMLIEQLANVKKACEISGNVLDQAGLEIFCRSGYYDHHIKKMHRIYRKRMQMALKSARAFLPEKLCSFTKPNGGYTFWVELRNEKINEETLMKKLNEYNINVCPGSQFFQNKPKKTSFRISIAHRQEEEITEGIRRISETIKNLSH